MPEPSSPDQDVRRLYEDAEARTAKAFENVVGQDSFGELLARVTENAVALTRMGNDAWDLLLRNVRVAGRADITRLARQLARTEDKLELLLQEVEGLRGDLAASRPKDNGAGPAKRTSSRSRSSRTSS
jgi:hypothetical protein